MPIGERRQAILLERYWARLRRDRRATPLSDLDPRIAALAARLERDLAPPAPGSTFAEQTRRRIAAQAERMAEGETFEQPARPQRPTAPSDPRALTPTQRQPRERRHMQSSVHDHAETGRVPGAPPHSPRNSRYSEYGKLAAAIAIFAVVGLILVLVLRDDDDEQTAQPLPTATQAVAATPTTTATPTAAPTQTAAPTSTVAAIAPTAVPPTATVPAEPTFGAAFNVSVGNVVIPEGYAYLDIERVGWESFAGSENLAITKGTFLRYQESGSEACGKSPSSDVQIFRAGSSTPEPMNNHDQVRTPINAGDHVLMPVNTSFKCANLAAEPSLAWAGGVLREDPGIATGHDYGTGSVLPGSLNAVVAGAEAPGLPAGEATFTLQRIIIDPGDSVPGGEPAWTLVYAERGTLSVAVGGATKELAEGESTLVVGDAGYELLNEGDTAIAVLVFSVQPEGPEARAISVQIETLPEGSNYISLERYTWKPFGWTSDLVAVPGALLAYQDTGSWSCSAPNEPITLLHVDGTTAAMSADQFAPSDVLKGEGFVMAEPGSYNCVSGGQGEATQYQFAIYSGGTTGFDRTIPDGMTFSVLAGGPVADLPTGPVFLTIERVIIEPGQSVAGPQGVAASLFVESGSGTLSGIAGGETVMRDFTESTEQLPAGVEVELLPNTGVTLPVNNAATITNTGAEQLVVIITTVVPAG